MKLDLTVSVEKSGYDLMLQLAALTKAIKADHAAGGTGISGDISAAVAGIMPIIADLQGVSADIAEDKLAFIKGINIGAYEFVGLL